MSPDDRARLAGALLIAACTLIILLAIHFMLWLPQDIQILLGASAVVGIGAYIIDWWRTPK